MRRNTAIDRLIAFQGLNLTGQDDNKVPGFYAAIAAKLNFTDLHQKNLVFIVVAHLLHDLPYLLEGLSHLGDIGTIIPKESQYVGKVENSLRHLYSDLIPDSKQISKYILKTNEERNTVRRFLRNFIQKFPDKKIVILDHGGYFAPCMPVLLEPEFSTHIAGIVEHTLNGEIKYDNFLQANSEQKVSFPLSSIARSTTKSLEDKYVTNSIVSSIHHNLYSRDGFHQDFERLNIGIMGFGHMGAGVARRLLMLGRNSKKIKIYDISPEACARANHFFSEVFQGEMAIAGQARLENKKIKHSFLQSIDVVICATSQVALDAEDLAALPPNVVVIFVTSPDDLLSATALQNFEKTKITDFIYEFKNNGKKFYSVLSSINFLNGSIAHPILHLVFAATLNCILNSFKPSLEKVRALPLSDSQILRQVYINHFGEIERDVEAYNIYPLSFYFAGRRTQLKQLSGILQKNKMGVITSTSIEGLGGIGKTTLASQYAWESLHEKRYDYIIRLDASDENALCREFSHLANHLQITNIGKLSIKDLVRKVYERLAIYQQVLFIFDNASSYNTLQAAWVEKEVVNFLPPSSSGQQAHLIVTTRNLNFTSEQKIELDGLQPSEARDYIQHYLPHASDKDSDRLAALLSYFPLALSQAVAYLEQNKTVSIDAYITNYKTQNEIQRHYLNVLGIQNSSYQATVYTTWNISIAEVAKRNPLALEIINALAYFDESPIPLAAVRFLANSEFALQEATDVLRKYSLIQSTVISLRMHDLVQTVSRLYQEGANKRDALNNALAIAYQYISYSIATNSSLTSFLSHAEKVIKFHEESPLTKHLALAVKIKLLYHIGSTEHFQLLFSERAMQAFALAEQIYSRPECRSHEKELGDTIIWIYIHLANSSAGAGFADGYINALDKLLTAPGLTVQHIINLLANYGINADLNEAKAALLTHPNFPNYARGFLQNLAPESFFEFVLQDQYRKMWLSDIPIILEQLGARQLAIAYLMFKKRLVEAQAMAKRYVDRIENAGDMLRKIEAHCLLAEANIFAGSPDIKNEISRLEKVRTWFRAHPNIDQFWFDQAFYLLAVLYATAGFHDKCNNVLSELWDHMVREIPAATVNESIKKRLYNLVKLIEHFSALNQFGSDDYKKILAQTYRLAGRLLTALQTKPRVISHHPEADNPERIVIANYFEKSLQFDEDNAATYYDYGRFLYQNVRTHALAIEKFETVAVLESTKAEENEKIMYFHLGREGANLPKSFRQSGVLEQAHANALYYLACWYLVLINAKQGKASLCLHWFDLLALQIQKQVEHPELRVTQFSQGLFAGLQQKNRVAAIIKTRESSPRP